MYPSKKTTCTSDALVPVRVTQWALIKSYKPGKGLVTEIIAERYKAGESIKVLAFDYGQKQEEIEEAIRCELQAACKQASSFHR